MKPSRQGVQVGFPYKGIVSLDTSTFTEGIELAGSPRGKLGPLPLLGSVRRLH